MFDAYTLLGYIYLIIFFYFCLAIFHSPTFQSLLFSAKYRFRIWNRERKRRYILLIDGVIVPDNQMITKYDKALYCLNNSKLTEVNFVEVHTVIDYFHGYTVKEYKDSMLDTAQLFFLASISNVYVLRYRKGAKTKLYY